MEINDISKVLEHIKQIYAEKEALAIKIVEQKKQIEWQWCSEQLNELFTALAKAQSEMQVAGKDKVNPYYKSKYADWESVVQASRPSLSKYGISVTLDIVTEEDGTTYIICTVGHTSGQWKRSRMRYLPPKNDVQSMSSYNTSLKRLIYSNSIGVVVGDEDDDGEIAVSDTRMGNTKGTALNTNYNAREQAPQAITREQLEELEYELAEYSDIAENILNGLNLQSLADMPKSKYMKSIERIREIKLARKGVK